MSRVPGRLVEMSQFFACMWRPLENSQKHGRWSEDLFIFYFLENTLKITQKPWVAAGVTTFFLEITWKITQNYDCPGSLSEKYGNPSFSDHAFWKSQLLESLYFENNNFGMNFASKARGGRVVTWGMFSQLFFSYFYWLLWDYLWRKNILFPHLHFQLGQTAKSLPLL